MDREALPKSCHTSSANAYPERVRVRAVEFWPCRLPLTDPFVIATGRVDTTLSVIVRVTIEEAPGGSTAVGFGEAASLPGVTRETLEDVLASYETNARSLTGADVGALTDVAALLDPWEGHPVARGGLETALVDAVACGLCAPFMHLLAEYAALPTPAPAARLETDITLPIADHATMTRLAAAWFARGFRAFKVKVGKDCAHDVDGILRVARAHPDARFRLDANGGYDERDAVAMIAALAAQGVRVECFEQPCDREDIAGMAACCRAARYPIVGDESVRSMEDLERAHAASAITGANLKLMKFGGPLRAVEIGARARALGLPLMCGGMVETRVGMTASAHLAAALGNVAYCDLDTAFLLARDTMRGGYAVCASADASDVTPADGPTPWLAITSAPGLGVQAEP